MSLACHDVASGAASDCQLIAPSDGVQRLFWAPCLICRCHCCSSASICFVQRFATALTTTAFRFQLMRPNHPPHIDRLQLDPLEGSQCLLFINDGNNRQLFCGDKNRCRLLAVDISRDSMAMRPTNSTRHQDNKLTT